jgi:hypothetical protein
MRQVPNSFVKACGGLHQDIALYVDGLESLAKTAIDFLDSTERDDLRIFLAEVLSGDSSPASLRNIWRAAGSSITFPKAEDLKIFLEAMLRQLHQKSDKIA